MQYIPQLRTTLLERSSGSLSVSFYLLQAAGGLIVAAEQVFAAADPWPVWLPFLCSTSMQLVVALCCVYFDFVALELAALFPAGDGGLSRVEWILVLYPPVAVVCCLRQGRKRVIRRRFNVGVLEAISERKASTL